MGYFKQYKISDLIKALQYQKKAKGDLPVEMSIDDEGNEFHPIGDYINGTKDKKEIIVPFCVDDGKLTIYPCE